MKFASILFIEDAGLWLSVRAGELALRQRDGAYVHLPDRTRTIVAAGRGFCVTTPAIRYCSAKHIELFISDDAAAFVSLFAPIAIGDARRAALKVREKQFRANRAPPRPVRGTGGSIHGAGCGASDAGDVELCHGNRDRPAYSGDHRNGIILDPCFGFLHDGRKPGRLSLVWDAVEPHRPELVRAVFRYAEGRPFKRYDFGIFANDGVGLLPPLAREIAELTVRTVTLRDMVKTVDWIAGLIKS